MTIIITDTFISFCAYMVINGSAVLFLRMLCCCDGAGVELSECVLFFGTDMVIKINVVLFLVGAM